MLIRYKIYNNVKTVTVLDDKKVEDLRNVIIDKNNIDKRHKLKLFFCGDKMVKSRKLSKYALTCSSIVIVKVFKKKMKDRIRSAMSPRVNLNRLARGFGPRGHDWVWSRSNKVE